MKKFFSLLLTLAMIFTMVIGGSSFAFAADSTASTTMKIAGTDGTVTITTDKGKDIAANVDTKLLNGYTVKTAAASYCFISLDDSKAIKLGQNTKVKVEKSGKKIELNLKSGEIYFDVDKKLSGNESMNIKTANMTTGIRGTNGVAKIVESPLPVEVVARKASGGYTGGYTESHEVFQLFSGKMQLRENSSAQSVAQSVMQRFVTTITAGNQATVTPKSNAAGGGAMSVEQKPVEITPFGTRAFLENAAIKEGAPVNQAMQATTENLVAEYADAISDALAGSGMSQEASVQIGEAIEQPAILQEALQQAEQQALAEAAVTVQQIDAAMAEAANVEGTKTNDKALEKVDVQAGSGANAGGLKLSDDGTSTSVTTSNQTATQTGTSSGGSHSGGTSEAKPVTTEDCGDYTLTLDRQNNKIIVKMKDATHREIYGAGFWGHDHSEITADDIISGRHTYGDGDDYQLANTLLYFDISDTNEHVFDMEYRYFDQLGLVVKTGDSVSQPVWKDWQIRGDGSAEGENYKPYIDGQYLNAAGDTIVLHLSNIVDIGTGAAAEFTVSGENNGTAVNPTVENVTMEAVSFNNGSSHYYLKLKLDRAIESGTVTYSGNAIKGENGNPLRFRNVYDNNLNKCNVTVGKCELSADKQEVYVRLSNGFEWTVWNKNLDEFIAGVKILYGENQSTASEIPFEFQSNDSYTDTLYFSLGGSIPEPVGRKYFIKLPGGLMKSRALEDFPETTLEIGQLHGTYTTPTAVFHRGFTYEDEETGVEHIERSYLEVTFADRQDKMRSYQGAPTDRYKVIDKNENVYQVRGCEDVRGGYASIMLENGYFPFDADTFDWTGAWLEYDNSSYPSNYSGRYSEIVSGETGMVIDHFKIPIEVNGAVGPEPPDLNGSGSGSGSTGTVNPLAEYNLAFVKIDDETDTNYGSYYKYTSGENPVVASASDVLSALSATGTGAAESIYWDTGCSVELFRDMALPEEPELEIHAGTKNKTVLISGAGVVFDRAVLELEGTSSGKVTVKIGSEQVPQENMTEMYFKGVKVGEYTKLINYGELVYAYENTDDGTGLQVSGAVDNYGIVQNNGLNLNAGITVIGSSSTENGIYTQYKGATTYDNRPTDSGNYPMFSFVGNNDEQGEVVLCGGTLKHTTSSYPGYELPATIVSNCVNYIFGYDKVSADEVIIAKEDAHGSTDLPALKCAWSFMDADMLQGKITGYYQSAAADGNGAYDTTCEDGYFWAILTTCDEHGDAVDTSIERYVSITFPTPDVYLAPTEYLP